MGIALLHVSRSPSHESTSVQMPDVPVNKQEGRFRDFSETVSEGFKKHLLAVEEMRKWLVDKHTVTVCLCGNY